MITRETLVSSQILGPARPPTGQNILGAGIDPARIGVRALISIYQRLRPVTSQTAQMKRTTNLSCKSSLPHTRAGAVFLEHRQKRSQESP